MRARHDHAAVDIEGHAVEPGFVQQVGRRDALLDSLSIRGARPRRGRAERFRSVSKGKPSATKDEESGLVARVVGAMAVVQARRLESPLRLLVSAALSVKGAGRAAYPGRCAAAARARRASMCSLILWMLALTGPNSITSGQISTMKRPSEVPPVVDSSASWPVCRLPTSAHGLRQLAALAEERLAAQHPGDRVVEAVLLQDRLHPLLQRGVGAFGGEAEVEVDLHRARESRCPRRCRHGCWRPASWSAGSSRCRRPIASAPARPAPGASRWIGFLRQVRVGDVALDPVHQSACPTASRAGRS